MCAWRIVLCGDFFCFFLAAWSEQRFRGGDKREDVTERERLRRLLMNLRENWVIWVASQGNSREDVTFFQRKSNLTWVWKRLKCLSLIFFIVKLRQLPLNSRNNVQKDSIQRFLILLLWQSLRTFFTSMLNLFGSFFYVFVSWKAKTKKK